jgi:hypothetical protein
MPKDVMEKLGLEVTRPYKYLHSFDSSKVKCIGLIKDFMHHPSSNPNKEYGDGYRSCRHSPKIRYVTVKIMGS